MKNWLVTWLLDNEELSSASTNFVLSPTREEAAREIEEFDPAVVVISVELVPEE